MMSSEMLDNSSLVDGMGVEVMGTKGFEETFLKVFCVLVSKSTCGNDIPLLL